jgi:hypothetical protein
MTRRKGSVCPHVLANIESESRPEYRYVASDLNPLAILCLTPDGVVLPERTITVIRGSRDALLRELKQKQNLHESRKKPTRGPSITWGRDRKDERRWTA